MGRGREQHLRKEDTRSMSPLGEVPETHQGPCGESLLRNGNLASSGKGAPAPPVSHTGKPATPFGKKGSHSSSFSHTRGSSSSPPSEEIEIIEDLCQGSSQAPSLPDSVSPLSIISLRAATQTKRPMLSPQAQVPLSSQGASASSTKPLILAPQKLLSPVTMDTL